MAATGSINPTARASAVPQEHELTEADKALLGQGGDLHKVRVDTPYQEYPRHLHKLGTHKKTGEPVPRILVVNSDEEKAAGVADGWSLTAIPIPSEVDEPEVEPAPTPKGKKSAK